MWLDAIKYLLQSEGDYRIHSPFVYDFYGKVVQGRRSQQGEIAANIYREMLDSDQFVRFTDMGAGSQSGNSSMIATSIGDLARRAARRRSEGEFLLRLARYCQPKRMLELGTHLGISGIYQKLGFPGGELHSIEGSEALAAVAAQNFEKAGLEVRQYRGDFEEVLKAEILPEGHSWPYVFVDGNHSYEASLSYFRLLLPHVQNGGLMIFDDIYWSTGMKKAWKEIHSHPEVSVSIDLFRFGLCFIRRAQAKEHFRLRSLGLLL